MNEAIGTSDHVFRSCLLDTFKDIFSQLVVDVAHLPYIAIFWHSIDKEVLAILHIRLMLLQSTILFSKKAFEIPCRMITNQIRWSLVVNLIWLMCPIVSICSLMFCYIWLNWLPLPPEEFGEDFKLAIKIIGVSCVIAALVEPVYIFAEAFQYKQWKGFMNHVSLLMRGSLRLATIFTNLEGIIMATAYGELATSIVYVVLYWIYFYWIFKKKAELLVNGRLRRGNRLARLPFCSVSDFLPSNVFSSKPFLDTELARNSMRFFKYAIFKQVYTYGEKYVMAGSPAIHFAEQGSYEAAIGLIIAPARLIFRAVEENSYFYFAQKLDRNKLLREHAPEDIVQLSNALYKLIRIFALLGYVMFIFGLSYSFIISQVFGGSLFTGWPVPLLLKLGCFTILLQAINGVTSSFAFAAMSTSYLAWYRESSTLLWWLSFPIVGLLSYVYGTAIFLIWEWCCLMPKIVHSLWFIHCHCQGVPAKPLFGLVPNRREALTFGTALLITLLSERFFYPYSIVLHLVCGVLCMFHVLKVVVFTELGGWNKMLEFLRLVHARGASSKPLYSCEIQ